jgi:hypothetical protein
MSGGRRVVARPVSWLGAVAVAGVIAAGHGPADAGHGGVVQLRAVPAGPYAVSVWTQPAPPRTGPWQVDVAVLQEGGAPVMDAAVHLRAEPVGDPGHAVETDASREADPLGLRHRAELALGAPGAWRVTVSVSGPRGPGAVTFPVDVEPAGRGWWLGGGIALGALALVVALAARRRAPGSPGRPPRGRPAERAR